MKILLVAINSKFSHANLAVWYLKREAEECGAEVEIFESNVNLQYHQLLHQLLEREFDAVGFSTYIFNRDIVEKLCQDVGVARPEALIFVGGGETYYHPNGMEKFAHLVLLGEGEKSVCKIARGELKKSEGIGKVVVPESVEIRSLVDSGYYDQQNKILYYESSRGCPFSCSYCLSGKGNTLKTMEEERVKRDIEKLAKKNLKLLKFVDRTFNARKDRGVSILNHIKEQNCNTCFHFEISPDLITDEFLQCVETSRAGQFQFEVGIQSFCEKTLGEVSRFSNPTALGKKIEALVATKKANVHVDLIVGLPFEDLETFADSFDKAYEIGSQNLQVGFLKVLPGTKMQEDAEKYGIIYSKFPPYQVFQTKWLSQKQVLELSDFEIAVEIFHNERKFEKSLELLSKNFASPFHMFWWLKDKINGDTLSLQRKVEILFSALCEFCEEEVAECVLRFDYLRVCKDKKFKAPLKNTPDENYAKRHQKEKFLQWFDVNPTTLEKRKTQIAFFHEEQDAVCGMYHWEIEKKI